MTFTSTWTLPEWTAYLGVPLAADVFGCEWLVERERGWRGSTGVRLANEPRPRRDGDLDGESFRTGRIVELEGTVIAPDSTSLLAAMDRASAVLSDTTALYPLTVVELDVERLARVRLADAIEIAPESPVSATWALVLRAPDHRKYGPELVLSTGLPVAATGLISPIVVVQDVGVVVEAGGDDGTVAAVNAGTAATHPLLEFVGPVTAPRVQSTTTGLTLALSTDVPAGQTLALDCAAGTVLLDGADRRVDLSPTSGFVEDFRLLPGTNELAFRAASSPGGALFRCTYRPAWL